MKYVDTFVTGQYDSKQDNKAPDAIKELTIGNKMNNCPNIKMPLARNKEKLQPYDVPPRPESIIDLNFERTTYDRLQAFVAIGQAMNALGKTFQLKEKYSIAAWSLDRAKVRFEIVYDDEPVERPIAH